MCVMISQCKIRGNNSHLLSQNVFDQSIIYQSEKTIHWNMQHFLAWGKSHVLPTELPFLVHHVSTINYYYWSIKHNCLLLLFFKSYFTLVLFLFISHLLKKSVYGPSPWQGTMTGGLWTQSMKVVHGPSPKWVHVLSSPVLTILCILDLSIINVSLCLCVFKINQIAGRLILLSSFKGDSWLNYMLTGLVV